MKKSLLFLGMLALGSANAQQTTPSTTSTTSTTPTTNGKVGVNTETPTRTLDINGDLRVRTLETLSDFNGLMVAETGVNGETNVVKKAEVKGKTLLSLIPITEAELKLSRTATTDPTKIGDRPIVKDNGRLLILPEVPVAAQEYLERSADKTYYKVLKSGLYHVTTHYVVRVDNSAKDSFDGSYGTVRVELTARTVENDSKTGVIFGSTSKDIYKGSKTPRITSENNNIENNNIYATNHRISSNGSVFVPKGGRIAVFVYSQGMASVVSDDSELDRITFSPSSSPQSSISIYVNL